MNDYPDWLTPVDTEPSGFPDWLTPGMVSIDIPDKKPSPKPQGPQDPQYPSWFNEDGSFGPSRLAAQGGLPDWEIAQNTMEDTGMSASQYVEYTSAKDSLINQYLPPVVRDFVRGVSQFGNKTGESVYAALESVPGIPDDTFDAPQRVLQAETRIGNMAASMDQEGDSEMMQAVKSAASSLGEIGAASALNSRHGASAYIATVGARQNYLENIDKGMSESDALQNAIGKSWFVELPLMLAFGKVSGKGMEGVLNFGGSSSIIGKQLAPLLNKIGPKSRAAATVFGNALSEAAEEDLTELGQHLVDAVYGVAGTKEELAARRRIARWAGAFGGGAAASPRAVDNLVKEIRSTTQQVENTLEQTTQAVEAVAAYDGEGDLTTRRTFERVTGLKNTTKKFRQDVVDSVKNPTPEVAPEATPEQTQVAPEAAPVAEPTPEPAPEATTVDPVVEGPVAEEAPLAEEAPVAEDDKSTFGFGVTPNLALVNSLPERVSGVRRFLRRNFGERGGILGRDIDDAREMQVGEVAKHMRRAKYAEADLRRALRSDNLISRTGVVPESLRVEMDNVLKGGESNQLPVDVVKSLKEMRSHVDALSRELLDSGQIDPESELAVTIEENQGLYINRIFRKHHRKNWVQEVMANDELRETGIEYLKEQYRNDKTNPRDITDEEAQAHLEILLSPNPTGDKVPAALQGDRKFMGILKKRGDLDETLLKLYGEYKDPFVNYTNTVSKIATMVSSHRMGENMRQVGLDTGLFAQEPTPGMYARIDGKNIPILRGLDGLLTTPEVKAELESLFTHEAVSGLARFYLRAVAYTKAAKTVLAVPRGGFRNFLGNTLIAWQAGDNPLGGWQQLRTTYNMLLSKGTEEQRAFIEHLTELGVIEADLRFGDIKQIMEAAEITDSLQQDSDITAIRLAQKGFKSLADFYQAADAAWKINSFLQNKKRYKKAYKGASEAETDKLAAEHVRSLYPTPSRAKQLGRWISRFPLVGDFALFNAEMIRTSSNAFRIGKAEIQEGLTTGNTTLLNMGARKLVGATTAPVVMPVLSMITMAWFGIDDEEDEDRRRFRPFYQENAPILYAGYAADGQLRQLDLGYMDPFQIYNRPLIALAREGGRADRSIDAAGELLNPFIQGGILTTALAEAALGVRKTGAKLYSEAASEDEKVLAMAKHIAQAFKPGVVDSAERIGKAYRGETNPWTQKQYSLMEESVAAVLSRSSSQNISASLDIKGSGYKSKLAAASGDVLFALRNPNNYPPEALTEMYQRREQTRRKVWNDWHEDYHAALRLGVPPSEARSILESTAGKENSKYIIAGKYRPYVPSDRTLKQIMKSHGRDRVRVLLNAIRQSAN